MNKYCETCKFSRTNTGFRCTMNSNNECGGDLNVSFEYNFWTPLVEDIENLFCKNCGKKWISHYGQFCYESQKEFTFCPEGYNHSDICARCNNKLSTHFMGIYCTITENTFIKEELKEPKDFLSDKDFEL